MYSQLHIVKTTVENTAVGKGLLYCIRLHHFYFQIIFKVIGKGSREFDLSVEHNSIWVRALLGLMQLGLKTGPLCPFEVYHGHST